MGRERGRNGRMVGPAAAAVAVAVIVLAAAAVAGAVAVKRRRTRAAAAAAAATTTAAQVGGLAAVHLPLRWQRPNRLLFSGVCVSGGGPSGGTRWLASGPVPFRRAVS